MHWPAQATELVGALVAARPIGGIACSTMEDDILAVLDGDHRDGFHEDPQRSWAIRMPWNGQTIIGCVIPSDHICMAVLLTPQGQPDRWIDHAQIPGHAIWDHLEMHPV